MNALPTSHPDQLPNAFERLVRLANFDVEQTALRRAIFEAVEAEPGDVESRWPDWFVQASQAVDLRVDKFLASSISAYDMADSGISLMTWHQPTGRFLIVHRGSRGRVHACWSDEDGSGVRTSPRHMAAQVAGRNRRRDVVWIVIAANDTHSAKHDHHPSPLSRFLKLLRPEASDIAVLFVLALVIGLLATAVPIAGQQLVRTVTFGTLYQPIIVLSLLLLLFMGFMGALQALNVFVVELIQQRLFARMVADLSLRLPQAEYHSLRQVNGPEFLNRFLEIATVQKVVAGLLVDGLALVLTTVIGMALLGFYHPFLLGYDLLLLALLLFVVLILGRGGTKTAIQESVEKYRIAAWLQELARCPLAFRLMGGADFAVARADRLTAGYLGARRRHFRVLLRQILCLFTIQALASTALLGLGGYLVMHEQLSLGQLVAAELIVTMIVGSFAKLAKHIEGFFDLMGAMDKLGHLVDLPQERGGHSLNLPAETPLVEFRMNRFRPWSDEAGRSQSVLEPQSLQITSGQHVAVWGGSASGKSHLADMLYGLAVPADGRVLVAGSDVRELSAGGVRRHVALIRDVEILAGTLEENLHLGRTEVDAAMIREVVQLTGLSDDFANLSNGWMTVLTCEGVPLSSSQQVRLMIARAVAGRPRLLVIDGLLDRLPDDALDLLLSNLLNSGAPYTLLVLTGRLDLARRLPRVVQLVPPQT